ncbi:MAG: hypothetical protein IKD69_06575, partial [Solobacterium sp.]|nr:hypothetical protein [Solobacterium sp.]
AFSKCVGIMACREYVKKELDGWKEDDLIAHKEAHEAKEQAARDRYDRKEFLKQLLAAHPYLEPGDYGLSKEDKKLIDEIWQESQEAYYEEMKYGEGWVERYMTYARDYTYVPVISLKITMLRKDAGMVQREFAKMIEYGNVNRYSLLEQGRLDKLGLSLASAFDDELIRNICEATNGNPYWLESLDPDTLDFVDKELTAKTKEEAMPQDFRMCPMYATGKVIRQWWRQKKAKK